MPGMLKSQRWIEGYQRIAEQASEMPDTRLIYVADREADILRVMQCAHQLGTPADWLIRSQHKRCLPEGGKLWATILSGPPLGQIDFAMPARQGQAARLVRQAVFSDTVLLPDGHGGNLR